MADPYELVRSGVANAFRGANEVAQNRLVESQRDLENAREIARRREERAFQVQRENEVHDRNRREVEKDRLRALRLQLAALLPPGESVPESMTEEEISRQIAERTRNQQIRYSTEDQKRLLDQEIEKKARLGEAELRREAETLGIENSTKAPLSELRLAVATESAKRQAKVDAAATMERVNIAKSTDGYGNLRQQLANLMAERSKTMALYALPNPIEDPSLTPEDQAAIFKQMAQIPNVRGRILAMKGGDKIVAMMDSGANPAMAMAALKDKDRESLALEISSNYDRIYDGLLKQKGYTMSKAADAYIAKLRGLPSALSEIDRRINDLYATGAKTGLDFGTALRLEDPDELLKLKQQTDAAENAVKSTGVGFQSPTAYGPEPPPLPPPGFAPSPSVTLGYTPVAGMIPSASNFVSDLVRRSANEYSGRIAGDPLLSSGLSQFSSGVNGALNGIGDAYTAAKVGLLGGNMPDKPIASPSSSPFDIPIGAAKALMSPFSIIGNTMRDAADGAFDREMSEEDARRILGVK